MQGGFVEGQLVQGGPQVQDVALDRAIGLEALADVLAQMNGEGAFAIAGLAMLGTGAAALLTSAAQHFEEAQVAQHLFHGDLLAHEGEIDLLSGRCRGRRGCFAGGSIDRRRNRVYAGISRGDHLLCGNVPFVARGFFVGEVLLGLSLRAGLRCKFRMFCSVCSH